MVTPPPPCVCVCVCECVCMHLCVYICVFVIVHSKYMCETAVVRGRAGKQAISALHLCQQSHTDVHTPHDDDHHDHDHDDNDNDDDDDDDDDRKHASVRSRQIGPQAFFGGKLGPGRLGPRFCCGKLGPKIFFGRILGPGFFWRQIGPLKNVGAANWTPGKLGPWRFCKENY